MNFWGPRIWKVMHIASYHYSDNPTIEQKRIFNYFYQTVIPLILPCRMCSRHYLKNLQDCPIRLKNRHKLIRWVVDIHNIVNKKKGFASVSYDQSDKLYRDKLFVEDIQQLVTYLQKRVKNRRLNLAVFNNFIKFVNQIYKI